MKKLINILPLILPVLTLVVIASLLLIFESDFLWKLQEENLFLNTKVFFRDQMVEPGGFLSWISTWFTQFFFHPWMGVLMLCGWWLLLMWLIQRTFGISRPWLPITIIPVLFLLVSIVETGYWIYIIKLYGHVFVSTIGTTTVVALLWTFRSIVQSLYFTSHSSFKTPLLCLFVVLTCAVGYPLLGIYGIGATALMAVWIWRLEPRKSSALAVSLCGLFSAWLLPLFFYRFVYYQTNIANIHVAKLPLYYVLEEYTSYYVPFLLLLLSFLTMCLISSLPDRSIPVPSCQGTEKNPQNQKKQKNKGSKSNPALPHWKQLGVSLLLLIAAAFYTYRFWYHDENFHHELAMQRCIDRLDWEGVLKEAAKQDDAPTRAIVMMRNLALARLGRQGNEMYHYKNGCKKCNAPFDIRAINSIGALIYFNYGMPNYSYRLEMERGVEFGWRAEQLKYMAKSALINGEQQLARKFLGLLKHTMFHDTWADHMYTFTEHPEDIATSPEMEFITHMMHYKNALTSDHNLVEKFLMTRLINTHNADDPLFMEQALYATLWAKDTNEFWAHLYNYTRRYPDRQWPIHIQEAALLFGTLEGRRTIDQWPISPAVRENYQRFDQMSQRYDGMDWDIINEALYPAFGNTYFYDYYMTIFPAQN